MLIDTSVNAANQLCSLGVYISFDHDTKFFACFIRFYFFSLSGTHRDLHSFPTRRSSDLLCELVWILSSVYEHRKEEIVDRSEEHTSELQSHVNLVCRLLLEKKNRSSNTAISVFSLARDLAFDVHSNFFACLFWFVSSKAT